LFNSSEIINIPPYSLPKAKKADLYLKAISELTKLHYDGCPQYRRILDTIKFDLDNPRNLEAFPFLPVRLFKEYDLMSVGKSEVIKTLTSSGTTGQAVSKIYLDRETAANQTKALVKIASSFLGTKRLPMLVIDTKSVVKDRNLFSARGAGILGFSMLGYDITYALDDQMNLDMETISSFLEKHNGTSILLFGFTFMIWKHFRMSLDKMRKINIDNGIMIHGGGWKRLYEQSVDNDVFRSAIAETCGIKKVYNYYGMVEQTGSIFMECEYGHLHASIFSDVIIRDHRNFESLGVGKEGLIQLISILPASYPGHLILSEDLGELLGEDDCPCGRMGKYFKVHGRIQNAEIRGCSDTYASGSQ
jgi:phenylacetate-coenzyme A ligase PaaK-like adenylate-forming protein